jgi:hypothetical protein
VFCPDRESWIASQKFLKNERLECTKRYEDPPQYSTVLPTGTLRGKSSEAFSSPDQLETGDGADHFRAVDNRPIRARWEV